MSQIKRFLAEGNNKRAFIAMTSMALIFLFLAVLIATDYFRSFNILTLISKVFFVILIFFSPVILEYNKFKRLRIKDSNGRNSIPEIVNIYERLGTKGTYGEDIRDDEKSKEVSNKEGE